MAQVVTTDANLLTIYKTWYTGEPLQNLLFQNSPVARKIQKIRIGGRQYGYAMQYAWGGAVSGDYQRMIANIASMSQQAEALVPPGKIFAGFTITQLEKFASKGEKAAYIDAAIARMFGATEGLRKTYAACLYGSGYGEFGQLPAAVLNAATTMTVTPDTAIKMSIGTAFKVTGGASGLPSEALASADVYTVTALSDQTGSPPTVTVTFTPAVVPGGGWPLGGWIELDGGRAAGGTPNMPTGLGGWLPNYFNRTGATWNTYIGTGFYNVNRSVSVPALAGQFYLRVAGETKTHAVLELIRRCRRNGSRPTIIVMNDLDFMDVIAEQQANTTYMQMINTGASPNANQVAAGLQDMEFQFSTTWIKYTYEDPYCPQGTFYVLDEQTIRFLGLSNVDTPIDDGIKGNEPGTQNVESVEQPGDSFAFVLDDYLNIVPNTTSTEGPAEMVTLNLYGNWMILNPAHCGAGIF